MPSRKKGGGASPGHAHEARAPPAGGCGPTPGTRRSDSWPAALSLHAQPCAPAADIGFPFSPAESRVSFVSAGSRGKRRVSGFQRYFSYGERGQGTRAGEPPRRVMPARFPGSPRPSEGGKRLSFQGGADGLGPSSPGEKGNSAHGHPLPRTCDRAVEAARRMEHRSRATLRRHRCP